MTSETASRSAPDSDPSDGSTERTGRAVRTVREVAFDLFRAHGMTTMFGNPGSTELPMLAEFPDDFRYVLGLHEGTAVGMADGYAQATGRPALVNLHTAPGVGNAIGALVNAHANGAPLVITAGQQVRPMLTLEALLTNPRSTELPQPAVKFAAEPARAQDVPAVLARAIHTATTSPRGPVFVSIPMDDWGAPASAEHDEHLLVRRVRGRAAPEPDAVAEIAAALDGARAPALVMGGDVDAAGGWDDAVALAERVGAPVFSPPTDGRVGFPQNHPQYRGPLPMAIAPLADALEGYDVVLVVGAAVFRYYPYAPGRFLPAGTRLLQVTASADEAARAPMGDAVVADPGLTLRALLGAVGSAPRSVPAREPASPVRTGEPGSLTADEIFATAAEVFPPAGVVINEVPTALAVQQQRLPATRPGGFYFTASGGLGFALPASIGVALADPSRPVLATIGDGSMQYAIQALATAAAQQVPVTILVLDNGGYGILKWFASRENTPKAPGLDLPPVDFLAVARGYGVPAEAATSTDELREALRRGFAGPGPRLVHVPLR